MKDNFELLANDIIWYRAKHGLSQDEMAKTCNVSKQTIFNLEHQLQTPTKLTEMKIRLILEQG